MTQPRDYMEPPEDDAPTEDEIRRQLGWGFLVDEMGDHPEDDR